MIRLKNREQMLGIRDSCKVLSEVLAAIRPMIREGVTTKEIDQRTHELILAAGGVPAFLGYNGYPASICISVNEEVIHGIPGRRRLAEGDVVGLDLGVNLKGFFSDAAMTLPVGRISAEADKLLAVTRECLDAGIASVRVGGRIHDVSRAVFKHANDHGYGVVREYCGHGLGFALHEDPQVPNYLSPGPNPRIQPGMVFAIEPMINLGTGDISMLDDDWTVVTDDGKISAHFEHTIAITENGPEVLTFW